jgi:uncharacterized membrane protein
MSPAGRAVRALRTASLTPSQLLSGPGCRLRPHGRRFGAGAVTTVIVAIVLPYILIAIPFMPASVSNWLTRVTPAAAFAVQQTLVPYHQVTSIYTPYNGYYPLAPWAGLAVLAGYAVVSLAVAAVLLRRRDA